MMIRGTVVSVCEAGNMMYQETESVLLLVSTTTRVCLCQTERIKTSPYCHTVAVLVFKYLRLFKPWLLIRFQTF